MRECWTPWWLGRCLRGELPGTAGKLYTSLASGPLPALKWEQVGSLPSQVGEVPFHI